MALLLSLCVAAAVALWVRNRVQALEQRAMHQERRIASLTERIFQLESRRPETPAAAPPPTVELPTAPVAAVPVQPAALAPIPAPPVIALPTAAPPPAPPAERDPPGRDLEALIGGNWLSKLGVLMLLIGIALFLGFSLTEMGPLGRILTGTFTSLALLGAGVAAERNPVYRVLGTALIGGGWAGLYFTAFAAHGIPASQVIDSPGVGVLLLLAVASGMILHSLRYQSQTVTGLAYMAAFLTIAISSLTQFSAIASIPLLLSLLVVAWKYNWQRLAAAGALFAYAAYGFDLATGDKDRYFLAIGEPVVWTYWLILEAFDLASKRRGADLAISPLNLTGFLIATVAVWPRGSGWQPDLMLGLMAAAQLMSAVLRGRMPETVLGGYRASITFSALFTAAFIGNRFMGNQRCFAFLLLAQTIAVSGWLFRSPYLRGLGAALFVAPLAAMDMNSSRPVLWSTAGLALFNRLLLQGGVWYSIGAVLALAGLLLDFETSHLRPVLLTITAGAVGLVLRLREKPEARWAGLALAVASVLALVAQMPEQLVWVTIGLPAVLYLAFGVAIPEGWQRLATFLLFQFYAGALCYRLIGQTPWLMAAWMAVALACWAAGMRRPIPSLAGSALMLEGLAMVFWAYDILGRQSELAAQLAATAALFAMYLIPVRGGDPYSKAASALHGGLAAVVTTALLQDFVSGKRLTLAWGVEAFVFLGVGIGLQRRQLRLSGLLLFAVCLGKLFFFDFSALDTLSRILSFIVLGCLLIAASWAYSRFREQVRRLL